MRLFRSSCVVSRCVSGLCQSFEPAISRQAVACALPISSMAQYTPLSNKSCDYITNEQGSTHLVWKTKPSNVLIIKKIRAAEVQKAFKQLVLYLCQEKQLCVTVEPCVFEEFTGDDEFSLVSKDLKKLDFDSPSCIDDIDFIVCLGGDGTLLYLSSLFQEYVPPIIPFHLGSLGFLMTHAFADFEETLERTLSASADSPLGVTVRVRLNCELQLASESEQLPTSTECRRVSPSGYTIVGPQTRVARMAALNEVVIDRGSSPYLTGLELACNGKYVADVQGDGVIIATPTGSTAYAAAAGGPMVEPGVPGITIAPICPHSLSFRPVVVSLQRNVQVRIPESSRMSAWVSCDGRNRQQLQPGDGVQITSHLWPMACINKKETTADWFTGLAECLQWNARLKQKPLM
ncbi:NAD kinase-like [Sycon ciliatum]|uniref:NAD kinase-like n=1 Tax=Sycon ciliatum TaxID=27933 RepID=UPI0020AA9A6D|eukprot:scpid64739/ scgid12965/ NAD kinase; Poly(P)/ATP NAD kinase